MDSNKKEYKCALDYDCISKIYEFLEGNIEFFMFIVNNDACPQLKFSEADLNWWDLTLVNYNDIEFVKRFDSYVKWDLIKRMYSDSVLGKKSIKFLKHFRDRLDWKAISSNWGYMDIRFIDTFQDILDWDLLSKYFLFKKYTLKRYSNKINWDILMNDNPFINKAMVRRYLPIQFKDTDLVNPWFSLYNNSSTSWR